MLVWWFLGVREFFLRCQDVMGPSSFLVWVNDLNASSCWPGWIRPISSIIKANRRVTWSSLVGILLGRAHPGSRSFIVIPSLRIRSWQKPPTAAVVRLNRLWVLSWSLVPVLYPALVILLSAPRLPLESLTLVNRFVRVPMCHRLIGASLSGAPSLSFRALCWTGLTRC